MKEPLLTVIVPIRPDAPPPRVLPDMPALARRVGPLELIVSVGHAAAQQRNYAAGQARASILYFLDDDSTVSPETLARGLQSLHDTQAAAIGGPALTSSEATFLEQCFGELAASRLAMWRMAARASPLGELRRVDGEELILCNLMIRKSSYRRILGLDERLYPGEEADLWKRLRAHGQSLYYDPRMSIARGRRRSLPAFCLQQLRYGQARGFRFTPADSVFLLPSLLCAYLLCLPLGISRAPLQAYLALCLAEGAAIWRHSASPARALVAAACLPLMHIFYGLGLLVGLLGHAPPVELGPPRLEVYEYDV